ncbi:hypothetical protein CRG98_029756 [Punica granatum]|uniref:Uncharacterized protein n=1 Tax=Punica granatum TaxID=22663 RepID=A0A2I0J0U1_PUNGR|nr:hypothetical protein CRG98_029756 [Punica granatum]
MKFGCAHQQTVSWLFRGPHDPDRSKGSVDTSYQPRRSVSRSLDFSYMCAPEFHLVEARMSAPSYAAWVCPPSRGRATDAHEKESPLLVYDPKVEDR